MNNGAKKPVHGRTRRRLKDKVAIVVGGGRGIGEAIALRFAIEGARVVLAARSASELNRVATQIKAANGRAHVHVTDVTDRLQVNHLVEVSLEAFGRIDVLVNAAGSYGPIGPLWEVDPEEWVNAFSVNVFSAFLLCQAVLPHMIRTRRGKIVHFSGGGATAPLPRFTAYGVSKGALVRLTETLAEEVREYNIQINAIAPGAVDTKLQDQVLAAGARGGIFIIGCAACGRQAKVQPRAISRLNWRCFFARRIPAASPANSSPHPLTTGNPGTSAASTR